MASFAIWRHLWSLVTVRCLKCWHLVTKRSSPSYFAPHMIDDDGWTAIDPRCIAPSFQIAFTFYHFRFYLLIHLLATELHGAFGNCRTFSIWNTAPPTAQPAIADVSLVPRWSARPLLYLHSPSPTGRPSPPPSFSMASYGAANSFRLHPPTIDQSNYWIPTLVEVSN